MVPVPELLLQHPKLVSKLQRFSFPHAAQLVGALGLLPELHENTIRVEVLAHLVAVSCEGDVPPKSTCLTEWLGKLMADSPLARMEDPTEDVFIGCVNSDFGSFRIFQGIFGDGAFLVERLLSFYAEKNTFPTFQETITSVLALLQLSDALADRAGLSRNCAGGGHAAQRIQLPRWRELEPRVRSVFFSDENLRSLGIDKTVLNEFFFRDEHRKKLRQEVMWGSSLERRPLLEIATGIIVMEPSTLARTAVRFMVERMKVMGGWGETFYQQENASIFVNEVRAHMEIEWLQFSPPTAQDGTPLMFPAFGSFDVGKPVIMLTYTPPLAGAVEDFGGFDKLTALEQDGLDRYVQACAAQLERLSGFSGGMILVCMAGYGRGGAMALRGWSPNWHVHIATLSDWLSLTADGGCTAMRLWKLGEHDSARERYGIELMNPAGLPNLVAWWKRAGFRLIPRQMDIHHPHNLVVIGCEFARTVRVEAAQERDEHCIRSHDGKRLLRVVRHNSRTLFSEDEQAPIYGVLAAAANKQLIGCTMRGRSVWWVRAPECSGRAELLDLLFQLWDCVLQWTDRFVPVAEREWPSFSLRSIEVRLVLPRFNRWHHERPSPQPRSRSELSVVANATTASFALTIPEGFLQQFNVPKNVAEQRIVAALFEGTAALIGTQLTPARIQKLVREVTRNEDARYFHVVETHEIEQLLGAPRRPHPVFIAEEDTMLAELGLADLAGRPKEDGRCVGRDECRKFLEDTVTKLWERIETRLRPFDRTAVVSACFRALDEITRDEAHWDLTTRSLLALHADESGTKRVLRGRRSQRSAANQTNRLVIETAQYACTRSQGKPFTMADHLTVLAEVNLLVTLAHHRDAIAFGFIKPEVTIHPNGEIEVDEKFYADIFSRYLSHRSDETTQRAAEAYETHFETHKAVPNEESPRLDEQLARLNEVFRPEFGFDIQNLVKVMDLWREFAIRSKTSGGQLTEEEMLAILINGCGFTRAEAESFLDRFTLPIRSAWDADFPPRCKSEDVYPWRFRRHLSVLMRPLVQIATAPRAWIISAPFFEKSCRYVVGNIEKAIFPERFFQSEQMRSFIGRVVNQRGHAFAEKTYEVFNRFGFAARLEIEMTELGAPKKEGLGDVDVLAWSVTTGRIFPVECKRLLTALTVREVIQRLEEFRGDKKAKDSLAKHLRRIEWLKQHPDSLAKITGIPKERIKLMPALVTSDTVPMQFYKEMAFPTDQVVAFDDLPAFLSKWVGKAPSQ